MGERLVVGRVWWRGQGRAKAKKKVEWNPILTKVEEMGVACGS